VVFSGVRWCLCLSGRGGVCCTAYAVYPADAVRGLFHRHIACVRQHGTVLAGGTGAGTSFACCEALLRLVRHRALTLRRFLPVLPSGAVTLCLRGFAFGNVVPLLRTLPPPAVPAKRHTFLRVAFWVVAFACLVVCRRRGFVVFLFVAVVGRQAVALLSGFFRGCAALPVLLPFPSDPQRGDFLGGVGTGTPLVFLILLLTP